MADLVPYKQGISIPPHYQAVSLVSCVPGCGVDYQGPVALVLTPQFVNLCGQQGTLAAVSLQSIIRVKEREFKGLVLQRYTEAGFPVLVAPNETFGVEIIHKGAGALERSLSVLTFSATKAREWVDIINRATAQYNDDLYRAKDEPVDRPKT